MFDFIFDVAWVLCVYAVIYKLVDVMLSEYSQIFKELFNVDVRYYNYTKELSVEKRHDVLHTFASSITFVLVSINPVVRTTMYLVFFFMVDVLQVNRIIVTILIMRMLKLRYSKSVVDISIIASQVLYMCLYYVDVKTLIPVIFQLLDELGNVSDMVGEWRTVMKNVFDREPYWITHFVVMFRRNQYRLERAQLACMFLLLCGSILLNNAPVAGDILFYYYAVTRICISYYDF